MSTGRIPPHSVEVEEQLISAFLLDGSDALTRSIQAGVTPSSFYVPSNRVIFDAIMDQHAAGAPIDAASIGVQLQTQKLLDEIGGWSYLTRVSSRIATTAGTAFFVERLLELQQLREAIRAAAGIVEDCYNYSGGGPLEHLAPGIERLALTLEGKGEAPILDMLDARAFSVGNQTEKPKLRVWLGGSQICTSGNLSALIAQAKAGKSTVVGAILAAFLGADEDEALGFKAANAEGFAVLHFDTEQSNYDSDQLIRRSMARAGVQVVPRWFLSYRLAGLQPKQVRMCIQRAIARAAKAFGGLALIVVDGVADAVVDVNDPGECNPYIAELQGTAIDRDCPILVIIHQNPQGAIKAKGPESAKARGHLGSQLERKCESNIYITKTEEGVSVLWSDKMRGAPIPLSLGPAFAWHDELSRHVLVQNPHGLVADKKTGSLAPELDAAWPSNAGSMKRSELVEQLAKRNDYTTRTAERRLKAMLAAGLVELSDGMVKRKR